MNGFRIQVKKNATMRIRHSNADVRGASFQNLNEEYKNDSHTNFKLFRAAKR